MNINQKIQALEALLIKEISHRQAVLSDVRLLNEAEVAKAFWGPCPYVRVEYYRPEDFMECSYALVPARLVDLLGVDYAFYFCTGICPTTIQSWDGNELYQADGSNWETVADNWLQQHLQQGLQKLSLIELADLRYRLELEGTGASFELYCTQEEVVRVLNYLQDIYCDANSVNLSAA